MDESTELESLRERAKELRCLYRVTAAVAHRELPPHEVFRRVLAAMPEGWQFPELTRVHLEYYGRDYSNTPFVSSPWRLRAPLMAWQREVGMLEVAYVDLPAHAQRDDPFLVEEHELIQTIALRLGEYLEWKHQELVGERIGAGRQHWRWRERYAQRLAAALDPARFGVTRVYLGGSTELGTAGPGSDIDLLIVFRGDDAQRRALELWVEGWSLCLAEVAREHTGYRVEGGLLDLHLLNHEPDARTLASYRELSLSRHP